MKAMLGRGQNLSGADAVSYEQMTGERRSGWHGFSLPIAKEA